MQSATGGRAAMIMSRAKPVMLNGQETLGLVLSHKVERIDVPLC